MVSGEAFYPKRKKAAQVKPAVVTALAESTPSAPLQQQDLVYLDPTSSWNSPEESLEGHDSRGEPLTASDQSFRIKAEGARL